MDCPSRSARLRCLWVVVILNDSAAAEHILLARQVGVPTAGTLNRPCWTVESHAGAGMNPRGIFSTLSTRGATVILGSISSGISALRRGTEQAPSGGMFPGVTQSSLVFRANNFDHCGWAFTPGVIN